VVEYDGDAIATTHHWPCRSALRKRVNDAAALLAMTIVNKERVGAA